MDPQPHPADIWQQALSQLQGCMDRQTFDWLLRGSQLLEAGDTTWTIAVPHPAAIDWLTNRLRDVVGSTLSRLTGRVIALDYVVFPAPPDRHPEDAAGPDPEADPDPPDLDPFLSFDPNAASGGGF
jgi:chromosomal replication initiation ATPase DnaA